MLDISEIIELLETVTVDCKDNGDSFVVTDRVEAIKHLLEGSVYKPIVSESLVLVYAKREFSAGESVVLVSAHVDCLYDACFCNDEGDSLRGTFDNSLGNAAILSLMIRNLLPDNVVVAFTGDEEHDSQGAVQTVLALGRMQYGIKFALVLDVTNTGYENGAQLALENDLGVDILTAHRIVGVVEAIGAKYEFKHCAEPDESWDYNDYGIPVLSVCAVVGGFLHSNEGVVLQKNSLIPYCNSILAILNATA